MKIIIALLVFSVIILFHELGHFTLAKLNKIGVIEFSLGMGPRLLSFEKSGTRYSLKLLPFGGSCMMLGEDMEDVGEGSFGSKSVWARMSVIAAGPIFNFILAFVFSIFIVAGIGYDPAVVLQVTEGYPAAEAGMEAGDVITGINGKSIHLYREVSDYVMFHQKQMADGNPVRITYLHNGEKKSAELIPEKTEYGRYIFGVSGSSSYREKASFLQVFQYSAYEVKYWISTTFSSLKMLFEGEASVNELSGPVGVVDMIGETYEQSKPDGVYFIWLNMVNMVILLSATIGVMNLLPIPALDGGRLFFLIIEAVRRKKINPEIEARIHFGGLVVLLLLMVFVMGNDIRKIFIR